MAHFRIKLARVCSFTANISMLNYVCSKLHPKPNKADTGIFLRGAFFSAWGKAMPHKEKWNYIKLLFEAAERYVLLGVLVYTAPVAFSMGASQTTSNIFKSWCRMFGGQVFLLIMNAWCLRLFTSMVGAFLANPLSL